MEHNIIKEEEYERALEEMVPGSIYLKEARAIVSVMGLTAQNSKEIYVLTGAPTGNMILSVPEILGAGKRAAIATDRFAASDVYSLCINPMASEVLVVHKDVDDWFWVRMRLWISVYNPNTWDAIHHGYWRCDQLSGLMGLIAKQRTNHKYKINQIVK